MKEYTFYIGNKIFKIRRKVLLSFLIFIIPLGCEVFTIPLYAVNPISFGFVLHFSIMMECAFLSAGSLGLLLRVLIDTYIKKHE